MTNLHRVTGAMSPARSAQAHMWHPSGEAVTTQPAHTVISQWAFGLPSLSFLLIHLDKDKSLGDKKLILYTFWVSTWAQHLMLGVQTSTLTYTSQAKPPQIPMGLSEETSEPLETACETTRTMGMCNTSCPSWVSLPTSASKPLWSVGRCSGKPKHCWWTTLLFHSCVGI